VATPAEGLTWVVTRQALEWLVQDPVVRSVFACGRLHVLMRAGHRPVEGLDVIPTASFGSTAVMAAAVAAGALPAGTGALLYDPEHWEFTPVEEQLQVERHVMVARSVADHLGATLIAAPAVSLTRLLPGRVRDRYASYLEAGIAASAAAADIVDVQAQNAVRDTDLYAAFVAAAGEQVHAVSPGTGVIAGLSTNPPGAPVDAAMLTSAIEATAGVVTGYWLNVPSPGRHCPTCNPPRPDIGIAALRGAFG
jgi:hypothetical protein